MESGKIQINLKVIFKVVFKIKEVWFEFFKSIFDKHPSYNFAFWTTFGHIRNFPHPKPLRYLSKIGSYGYPKGKYWTMKCAFRLDSLCTL